ncbi:MAG TPA: HAD family phosphatase [Thermoanaerobaculia bacterium]|nr:HAD family phosphatase [Thermoanaerobaculia bacterium]
MAITWFLFDLGNTVIKLAYERVLTNICRSSSVTRDELVRILEEPGGYRDMERGAISFWDFYEFLCAHAGYRDSIREFHSIWADFFDGTMPGIEGVLERVRERYKVAFLSNSNEVHAEVIPRQFAGLFHKGDLFIFSHRFRTAKPDPEMFNRALEAVNAQAQEVAFIDDLMENVNAARNLGIHAFQYTDSLTLVSDLEREGLL